MKLGLTPLKGSLIAILMIFLTCLMAGPATATSIAASSTTAPATLITREVSFRSSDGLTLHGTVLEQAGAQTGRAGLVLVHGSGTGIPRTSLLVEASAFARQGLSVLIYDKRAVGYSILQRSYSQLADDALAAVHTLQTQPDVDPAKVGIWGFSEGGWVAPLAAARSADIAFVILVGGNAMMPLREQTWQVASALRRQGVTGSLVERAEPNMYHLLANAGLFPEAYHDAEAVLRQVRQPLLGVWGSDDLSTPPQENPPLVARALRQGGNIHYTFRYFKGADHAAHQSPDGGITRLPSLAPGYAELVGSWVGEVTNGKLPDADAPTPPQQSWPSIPIQPSSWWEAAWLQFIALALLLVAFIQYPLVALARRIRGRSLLATGGLPTRLLAGVGAATVLGFFVYVMYLLISGGTTAAPGPVLVGRPILWLLLQALALVTIGAAVATVVALRRTESSMSRGEMVRIGLLLAGGTLFVPWALYWGLLQP